MVDMFVILVVVIVSQVYTYIYLYAFFSQPPNPFFLLTWRWGSLGVEPALWCGAAGSGAVLLGHLGRQARAEPGQLTLTTLVSQSLVWILARLPRRPPASSPHSTCRSGSPHGSCPCRADCGVCFSLEP